MRETLFYLPNYNKCYEGKKDGKMLEKNELIK